MNTKHLKIKDLIELPPIKTVVQLTDLSNAETRQMLLENFIITGEVGQNLEVILKLICEKTGQGLFIEGNFGSGKSHFLTVLASALENSSYWALLTEQEKKLLPYTKDLSTKKYSALKISLVEHSNAERLENIISQSAMESNLLSEEDLQLPRKDRFSRLLSNTALHDVSGVVILIDELSEFLRSKPNARSFNEEIRFLQYLGELSFSNPLWIVATLQEKIEDTGEITQETFNKIKDRYPVRLFLGSHHVEELISRRLVKMKSGETVDQKLNDLYSRFKAAFRTFPASEEKFRQIYPVHPATIDLLDNLKLLFSQHRGVVDFIHYQLRGDERRQIPGIMEEPAEHLLTPDYIFDHFQVRIKDTIELNPYLEVAFRYFEKNISKILSDTNQQQVAIRLIKILILAAISPRKVDFNIQQLGDMLLYHITDLDPKINYQFISEILSKLYQEGAYLSYHKSDEFLKDVYRIDLEANVNAIVQRKIASIISDLSEDDIRIYQPILQDVMEPVLPLKSFTEQPVAPEEYPWQQTMRNGWRIFGNLADISNEEIRRVSSHIQSGRADFLILIASPDKIASQHNHYQKEMRQFLADLNLLDYTVVWMPKAIQDCERLKEFYAFLTLKKRYMEDHSHTGRKVYEFLKLRVDQEKRKVREIVVNTYLEGEVLVGDYPDKFEQMGLIPFSKLMESVIDRLLTRLFPKHLDIAPYSALYTPGRVNDAIQRFFRAGNIEQNQADSSLRATLENYLKPLGLLARSGGYLTLRVDPRHSPIAQYVLDFLEDDPVEVNYIFLRAHHSAYGISREQFNFLLLALIFSGNALPYSDNKKIGLDKITAYNLENISSIGKGDVLDERTILALRDVPFIDSKFKQQKFSTQLQEQIFQQVKERVDQIREVIEYLRRQIDEARRDAATLNLPFENFERLIHSVDQTVRKIQIGRNSKEGLQNVTEVIESTPLFNQEYEQLKKLVHFFREYKTAYSQIHHYLNHPDLVIPSETDYQTLRTMKDELYQLFNKEDLVLSDDLHRVIDLFRDFQKEYITRYLLEHQQQKSKEAYQWIDQLRNSRSYLILRKLSTLRSIDAEPSAVHIEKQLNESESNICERPTTDLLKIQPACVCGFHLGEKAVESAKLPQFSQAVQQGLESYFQQLTSDAIVKQLKEGRKNLKSLQKNDKVKIIDEFLQLNETAEFTTWVESGKLNTLKDALESHLTISEVSVEELIGPFLNHTVEIGKFREYLLSVLKRFELGNKEVFIHLIENSTSSENDLSRKIAEKSPFVYNLFHHWNDDQWRNLLTAALWFKEHGLDYHKLMELLEFKIDDDNLDDFIREIDVLISEISLQSIGEVDEQLLLDWYDTLYQDSELDQLNEFVKKEKHFFPLLRHSLEKALKISVHRQPSDTKLDITKIIRGDDTDYHTSAVRLLDLLPQYFLLKKNLEKQLNGDLSDNSANWWNKAYTSGLFILPYLLDLLTQNLKLFDLLPLLRESVQNTKVSVQHFSENFQSVFPVLSAEVSDNRQSPISITELLPLVIQQNKREQLNFILVDGLRWDLFEIMRGRFLKHLFPKIKIVKEYAVWSVLPSNTQTVMEKLSNSLGQLDLNKKVSEQKTNYDSRLSEDVELVPDIWLHKINAIDNKIHTSKDNLIVFGNEMLLQVKADLERYFEKLQEGNLVLLFSDHGFTHNPDFSLRNKYEHARYQHGGGTPFEIIVPALLLQKTESPSF